MCKVVNKAYKFKVCPNNEQKVRFNQSIGCKRFVYNQLLSLRTDDTNKKLIKKMTTNQMVKMLPELKESFPFLKDAFSQSLQTSLRNLGKAFDDYFKGEKGFPTFQKRGRNDSMTFPQKFWIDEQKSIIFIPKIGVMPYKNSRKIKGKIKSITVSKKANRYYVSVLTEQEIQQTNNQIDPNTAVGIDVGLKEFAVLSDGTVVSNPKFYRLYEEKLAQEQRKLAKKVKFSSNWFKQLKKVQKQHHKIANCRYDFLQKLSTSIVKNHDIVCTEDLAVSNMVKNRNLAKSISDAGWGLFARMLEYKCDWNNKLFVKVDRFYPSSKTCSCCGSIKLMPLKLRYYVCEECNSIMDRDYNASINIKNKGLETLGLLTPSI